MLLTGERPPTRVGAVDGGRFHMLANDCQLLAAEIRTSDSLPPHAADFMLSLIDRQELRLQHHGIRGHGFAQAWRLPALDDAFALESWLERAA